MLSAIENKEFLTEDRNFQSDIEYCIKNKLRCTILYISDDLLDSSGKAAKSGKGRSWRFIEPHCLGVLRSGSLAFRSWQIWGSSLTPNGDGVDPLKNIPGWRLFKISNVRSINIMEEGHPQRSFADMRRPKYNPY